MLNVRGWKGIPGAAALLIVLASLTAQTDALAQERSSVLVSARVVDARPSWLAHLEVQTELKELAGGLKLSDQSVSVTEQARTLGGVPRPQVDVIPIRDGALIASTSGGHTSQKPSPAPSLIVYVAHIAN